MTYNSISKLHIFVITSLCVALAVLFGATQSSATAIQNGDVVQAHGSNDVYIVKKTTNQNYKRLILNPQIFNSYGHLSWNNIKVVPTSLLAQYKTSNLIRQQGDARVYELVASPNADTGVKHWVNMTHAQFLSLGFDPNSIYTINHIEGSNTFYRIGATKTFADYSGTQQSAQPTRVIQTGITPLTRTAQFWDKQPTRITFSAPATIQNRPTTSTTATRTTQTPTTQAQPRTIKSGITLTATRGSIKITTGASQPSQQAASRTTSPAKPSTTQKSTTSTSTTRRSTTAPATTNNNSQTTRVIPDDENPPTTTRTTTRTSQTPAFQIIPNQQRTTQPFTTQRSTSQASATYNPQTNRNCVVKNGYTECFVLEGRPSQYQWNSYVKGTCFGNCEFHAQRDHRAIDIRSATGTKVLAVWDGVVEFAGWDHAGCGETVTIRHPHINRVTVSCHLHPGTVQVRTGDRVKAGQYIGGLGRSGTLAFSTHLHFRVHDTTLRGWPYNHGWPLKEEMVVALEAFQGLKKGVFHGEHKRVHDARDHQYSHAI